MKKIIALIVISMLTLTACSSAGDKGNDSQAKNEVEKHQNAKKEPKKDIDAENNEDKANNDSPEGLAIMWVKGLGNSDSKLVCQCFSEQDRKIIQTAKQKSSCEEAMSDENDGLFQEITDEQRSAMKIMLPLIKPELKEAPKDGKAIVTLPLGEEKIDIATKEVDGKWYIDPEAL